MTSSCIIYKIKLKYIEIKEKPKIKNQNNLYITESEKAKIYSEKCYLSPDNSNIRIIH